MGKKSIKLSFSNQTELNLKRILRGESKKGLSVYN